MHLFISDVDLLSPCATVVLGYVWKKKTPALKLIMILLLLSFTANKTSPYSKTYRLYIKKRSKMNQAQLYKPNPSLLD